MRIVFARALDVGHIVKRGAELALLIDAVRTPVQAIHLGILSGNALGKGIVLMILVIPASEICAGKEDQNDGVKKYLLGLAAVAFAGFLPLSSLVGHDSFLISRQSGDYVQRFR